MSMANEPIEMVETAEKVEDQESRQISVVKKYLPDDDQRNFEFEISEVEKRIDQSSDGQLMRWKRLEQIGYQNKSAASDLLQGWETWSAKINFLNSLQGVINRYCQDVFEEYSDKWRTLLTDMKRIMRVKQLERSSPEEVVQAIMWMAEQGQSKELLSLQEIRYAAPQNQLISQDLFAIAEEKLSVRLYQLNKKQLRETMETYRVFCSPGHMQNFTREVRIIESYPSFVVVAAPEWVANKWRERFPVEKLELIKTPDSQTPPSDLLLQTGRGSGMSEKVVRFIAPIREIWKTRLEEVGVKVLQPLGRSAVVISVPTDEALEKVKKLEEVAQVDPYVPTIRLRPQLLEGLASEGKVNDETLTAARLKAATEGGVLSEGRNLAVPGKLVASFFTPADRARAEVEMGNQEIRISSRAGETRLVLDLSQVSDLRAALGAIVEQAGLRLLEEEKIMLPSNDVARRVIGSGVVSANPSGLSLTGKGEVIAIADTGIDTGDTDNIHPDFRGRVKGLQSYPIGPSWDLSWMTNPGADDGPADRFTGHGTHVAGSALGSGQVAEELGLEPIRGMAPEAELIFQAVEQSPKWTVKAIHHFLSNGLTPPPSGLFGIPTSLDELFQPAYDQGARIHSNSWGGGDPGIYSAQCEDLDRFVWEHKDFLVVVAAGNSGRHSNSSQGIDHMSIDSPGVAKNCLTVGASENAREGQFTDTYGHWWPDRFRHEPFKSDHMADSKDDIAAISSRGPCANRRHKPDIVAPGTFILSARSSQIAANNFGWAAYPPAKRHYMYFGGTSMATPLAAGGVALIRQYLRERRQIDKPSAALLKAAIIHSAEYIHYRYAHPGSSPYVDDEQGWGRMNLANVLSPPSPIRVHFIDEIRGMITGEHCEYQVQLADSSAPFRLTLVYSDYPGESLINNLNLIVIDPDGKHHLGNDFAHNGIPDSVNNVEGVVLGSPKPGNWVIMVIASDVAQGAQEFALVISGAGLAFRES